MNKNLLIIDEEKYPVAWRFNSENCSLSFNEKRKIIFLDEKESESLWNMIFPFDHLMEMNSSFCSVMEKAELDFDCYKDFSSFFHDKLAGISFIFFFWGRRSSAIVPVDIFIKSLSDFFYPSDETSIALITNRNKMIFSYEETFFYADISK